MIPQAAITAWRNKFPWNTDEQVEQDLIISRSIVEIFSDTLLKEKLAFRGGTAIHKLFLHPPSRYSEDIDLVQKEEGPFGEIIDRLRSTLSFLETPIRKQKESNNTLIFRFESEIPPVHKMRLKVETNCREHFSVLGFIDKDFRIQSPWFEGQCSISTYPLEELLGTKLRALYQRKKGRDLYDLFKALTSAKLNNEDIIVCYRKYMEESVENPPTSRQFILNMEAKMVDSEFIGDIKALIKPDEYYDADKAFQLIKKELLENI